MKILRILKMQLKIVQSEDVEDASKHGIGKIKMEILVDVENTVTKCSVLTIFSTYTRISNLVFLYLGF